MAMNLSKLWEIMEEVGELQSTGSHEVRHDLVTERQYDLKQINYIP